MYQATREYSIAIVGSQGVGKSSICLQFVRNKFPSKDDLLIEYYYRKQVFFEGKEILLSVIDIKNNEGSDIYSNKLVNAIKQAQGYLLVYDITDKETFEEIKNLYDFILRTKHSASIPVVLIGNKAEPENEDIREVPTTLGKQKAMELGCSFLEISALRRINLEGAMAECVKEIKQDLLKYHKTIACCSCLIF